MFYVFFLVTGTMKVKEIDVTANMAWSPGLEIRLKSMTFFFNEIHFSTLI